MFESEGTNIEIIMHQQFNDFIAFLNHNFPLIEFYTNRTCKLTRCKLMKSPILLLPTHLILYSISRKGVNLSICL
jgi:hypothetical protein